MVKKIIIGILLLSAQVSKSTPKMAYEQFCTNHFIGISAKEDCINLMESNRFFITSLRFCVQMRGNSQKMDCLMVTANKIFANSTLSRCMGLPFEAGCLGGEYTLIPQKDEHKVIIFNCTDQNVNFSMKEHPDNSWRNISLSSGGVLSEACTSESCESNPVIVHIPTDGGGPVYDLPWGNYYRIEFENGGQLLDFYFESDNIICG